MSRVRFREYLVTKTMLFATVSPSPANAQLHRVFLGVPVQSHRLQPPTHRQPRAKAMHSRERAAARRARTVVREDVDQRKAVALANVEVGLVMGRSDFHRTGAKVGQHGRVGNYGQPTVGEKRVNTVLK